MKKYIVVAIMSSFVLFIHASLIDRTPDGKSQLGEKLFFDPILSKNRNISCASCHIPEHAFADTSAVSIGTGGKKGTRNTPSAMNTRLQKSFFWDGRAKSLEEQVLGPIENPAEMGLPINEALIRLRTSEFYRGQFREVFNNEPDRSNLAEAIAAYERTLETSDSPFDNWKFSGDSNAVSAAVKRGFVIFNGKAKCSECHFGPDFTTNEFRNIGLFDGRNLNDSGRAVITGKREDIGKFKVPGLRNVAVTAPYTHNGIAKTLKEVIAFYDNPEKLVKHSINRDSLLDKPLNLTTQEKSDLEAFLISLTDKRFMPKTERNH
jgi:cytochrome c peroxidase